jgi:hypothetical protein
VTLVESLRKARELIAGGWCEPMSQDAGGCWCSNGCEGISRFCLADALLVSTRGSFNYIAAEDLLKSVLVPTSFAVEQFERRGLKDMTDEGLKSYASLRRTRAATFTLTMWLESPGRPVEELLRGFSLAILRAKSQQQ